MHQFGRPLAELTTFAASLSFVISAGSWVGGGSLRNNSADASRYVIAAQNNKGLSVSTCRKKGGDLASTIMWGWKRGVIIKYPVCPCMAWDEGGREPRGGGGGEVVAEGITLQGRLFWHNDSCVLQFVIESSVRWY